MADAIIVEKIALFTLPPIIIMRYEDSTGLDAGAAYTEFLDLPLYSVDPSRVAHSDSTDITWNAFAINISSISASCDSDKFTIKLVDQNNFSLLDSLDEVYAGIDINQSENRILGTYIIQNQDSPQVNKLYLYVENNGGVPTGPISIEIIYTPQSVGF